MKSDTYKEKAKELKEKRESLKDCPRNAKRIADMKAEEKRLRAKAKEKKIEEESKTAKSSNSKSSSTKKPIASKTITRTRAPKTIEEASKEIFEKGEKLDKKNKKNYENMSLDELKNELEKVKNFDVGCSQEEFEDVQSKAIVLNRLIKQKKDPDGSHKHELLEKAKKNLTNMGDMVVGSYDDQQMKSAIRSMIVTSKQMGEPISSVTDMTGLSVEELTDIINS